MLPILKKIRTTSSKPKGNGLLGDIKFIWVEQFYLEL